MLPRIGLPLMRDLPDVDAVRQNPVEVPAGEGTASGTAPVAAPLADEAERVRLCLETPHAADLEIKPEESPDRLSLGLIDRQRALVGPIAERNEAAHPHALGFR